MLPGSLVGIRSDRASERHARSERIKGLLLRDTKWLQISPTWAYMPLEAIYVDRLWNGSLWTQSDPSPYRLHTVFSSAHSIQCRAPINATKLKKTLFGLHGLNRPTKIFQRCKGDCL